MNLRPILTGIAFIYVVIVLFNVFGADAFAAWKGPLSYALLALALIGLGLHIAIVAISRSWMNAILAPASVLFLFLLFLRALMKVTGDSL